MKLQLHRPSHWKRNRGGGITTPSFGPILHRTPAAQTPAKQAPQATQATAQRHQRFSRPGKKSLTAASAKPPPQPRKSHTNKRPTQEHGKTAELPKGPMSVTPAARGSRRANGLAPGRGARAFIQAKSAARFGSSFFAGRPVCDLALAFRRLIRK